MSIIFVAHDVRLTGKSPTSYARWNVGESITLAQFAVGFKNWAAGQSDYITLKLWAHGKPGQLEFCHEWIWLPTVEQLRPLEPYVSRIDIYGCQLARIGSGPNADGNMLCCRLAQITQSHVRASSATQYYDYHGGPGDSMTFGKWEGTVLTYAPSGAVEKVETNPAF